MAKEEIHSVNHVFLGQFRYEGSIDAQKLHAAGWHESTQYEDSREYFDQKYYAVWLESYFGATSGIPKELRHLVFKHDPRDQVIHLSDDRNHPKGQAIHFKIVQFSVHLFPGGIGIFHVHTKLNEEETNWLEVNDFGVEMRRTCLYSKAEGEPFLVGLVENHITPHFHHDKRHWRMLNPTLRVMTLVDLEKHPGDDQMDQLLYRLGAFSFSRTVHDLYEPDRDYLEEKIDNHEIAIYRNWKALCLYDSISRVSVRLDDVDTYRLWTTEYVHIYVYNLFGRFFLEDINNGLINAAGSPKKMLKARDAFFVFAGSFAMDKIAHKFLPNIVHRQISKALDIQEHFDAIEDKLARLNTVLEEKRDRITNRILLTLTCLTVISVANDGGEMWKGEWNSSSFLMSFSLLVTVGSMLAFVIFRNRKLL